MDPNVPVFIKVSGAFVAESLAHLDIDVKADRDSLIHQLCMDEIGPMMSRRGMSRWTHLYYPGRENLGTRAKNMLSHMCNTREANPQKRVRNKGNKSIAEVSQETSDKEPVQPELTEETSPRCRDDTIQIPEPAEQANVLRDAFSGLKDSYTQCLIS